MAGDKADGNAKFVTLSHVGVRVMFGRRVSVRNPCVGCHCNRGLSVRVRALSARVVLPRCVVGALWKFATLLLG